VIEKAPPFRLEIPHLQTPFEALAESIVYQQLSGKAAASIFNRLKVVTNETNFPTPDEILVLPESTLRAVGLSRAKTLAIIDLAAKTKDGLIPTAEAMQKMADDELVERLTAVRGIGRWTVEMILIFRLGRLDVMPATDYGVRKGFALTYKLADLPSPAEIISHAEKWRPYRTIASWYMWRANEIFKTLPATATKAAGKIKVGKAQNKMIKTAASKGR
jgi:DNA-3-methyladenine glycosylase II